MEPMDADDWLKSVENKLQVIQCNNCENVLLASHHLSGPATDWWDAYLEAHEELKSINWPEFRAAFRAHHVPQGVIKLNKKEFQDLKQGSMSVNEYVTKFTQLSHYAPQEVDTDEKKQECFLNGLNDGLAYALEAQDFENFQRMVNKALMLENCRGVMEHKRKLMRQYQPGSSSRPRVITPLAGPVFRPAQPLFQPKPQVAGQGYSTPQRQAMPRSNASQTPTAGNQNVQRTQATQNPPQGERRCFACGEKCHFANQCPNPHSRPPQTAVSTPAPTCGANSIPVTPRQNYVHGKVNHIAMEEAQKAPDVVIGTFSVNDISAVVLFDSRASHSFISATYVEKHNLRIALLMCQMIVSSPGGDMPARQLCPKVNLKIRGVHFVANLIVLESKGIDVILGMDWLGKHKVLIDCAKKSVKLTTPDGKELEFIAEPVVTAKGIANYVKINQLDASPGSEVPVVNEFPDVFPEELSGMPPD
jgi:hypothetical protein